jgi:UDP-N-acetylmuramyl pentapeptide phosphotransferase/UDP-N-acetylglucosamine-1-phosphate transferase
MDGIDGLAASMGVIGFFAIYLVNLHNGQAQLASISSIVAFSCLGFLVLNFPPAKIFLGDVGSASLGYMMSVSLVISLPTGQQSFFGLTAGAVIFAPFLLDATFTITRRALAGEKIWEAHRDHLYQRLALSVGSRKALAIFVMIMLLCGLSSVYLLK